jgi:4-hydroxy-tetrahydrodipicolinate synthase
VFSGLSAFPITPTNEGRVDEAALGRLVARLADAGVDSIGAMGSTGSYAYLTRVQRRRAAAIAVDAAGGVPVLVGVGALRTAEVLAHVADAAIVGAAGVLLAPVSYQPLTDDEVFALYETVAAASPVPVCVYDNPVTTGFRFGDELHGRIGALPNVGAVKVPGVPAEDAGTRMAALRAALPDDVVLGVSGDAFAAGCLAAGAEAWFSVLAGLFPEVCVSITRAALDGDGADGLAQSARLEPLWALFRRHGSVRVVSAAAAMLGLSEEPNLPLPLRGLDEAARRELASALDALGIAAAA